VQARSLPCRWQVRIPRKAATDSDPFRPPIPNEAGR
jgi:hypothetical protein